MADTVKASHILVMYEGLMRSSSNLPKEEARTLIDSVKTQLDEGGDFAALAGEHSHCPSGQTGGDLGSFGRGQMIGEFEECAFTMEIDTVSDVVETAFGFHIIKRTG